ncbi:class I SAM-dependent methyltransferase [Methanosarcina sp. KYL-1]|uniref:class I SAM-dependent methyltransferase n=1 Tax=Methanosarcina sp. KYL-1 TaxID=2602068 RepID=UPI002101876C|nr:class I SAM-dependent methyltransferase [Methanosarcina sp. KYL-1]MCQ1536301.1 class I SAM-dependent methyltransferase [Methanosarcina sp. KYL-1]
MLLQELLGIDENIYLVEESYLAQRAIKSTLQYLSGVRNFLGGQSVRLLRVREGESTLGLLLFNPGDEDVPVDFWSVFTGALAAAPLKAEFESSADLILALNSPEKEIEVSAELWRDAVNEYYSLMLVSRNLCSVCNVRPESYGSVFSENRVQKVSGIFEKLRENGYSPGGKVLEVCCGNGMSTLALYRLGLDPLAVEVNKCTVCQGLEQGVLNPRKALVMDARALSRYFEPGSFDVVLGFMLGLVYEFNSELWTGIMREAAAVSRNGGLLLFTVSSKPEIEILAEALRNAGVEGEIVDNTDAEGVYDQWFFVGRKN